MNEQTLRKEAPGGWLTVAGAKDSALEQQLTAKSAELSRAEKITDKNERYIEQIKLRAVDADLALDDEELEHLRKMCSSWDMSIVPKAITSHRPIIGPIIVTLKKMVMPVVAALLKETLRQQREFNARTICLLAHLNRKKEL